MAHIYFVLRNPKKDDCFYIKKFLETDKFLFEYKAELEINYLEIDAKGLNGPGTMSEFVDSAIDSSVWLNLLNHLADQVSLSCLKLCNGKSNAFQLILSKKELLAIDLLNKKVQQKPRKKFSS